ncbi:response regulator transcription factor [Modestobacter sp. I12A-02662]|uniref:helix-turn-helix transcriptional regulator n=1 Tax=Modestobacter sp. I12A-02662 TaxID=1730496 RepID=UPI0034DFF9BA
MESTVQEITDFTIDVLDRLDGPQLPAEAVFSFLCPRLDSPGAVLQRTTWRTGRTDIRSCGFSPADVPLLIGATHAMRFEHPLMVANAAGDLTPATAQTSAGGWKSWHRSPARAFLADLRGWDQMISLPLRGGPTEVCAFAFSRPGRDYDDRELALAAAVQPLLRAMDRHVRVMGRWRGDDDGRPGTREAGAREAGLTGREVSVLLCLAEGLTAAAVAHRLGCSVRTVGKHTGNIYRKLGVSDRLTAVLVAQRRGIVRTAPR